MNIIKYENKKLILNVIVNLLIISLNIKKTNPIKTAKNKILKKL